MSTLGHLIQALQCIKGIEENLPENENTFSGSTRERKGRPYVGATAEVATLGIPAEMRSRVFLFVLLFQVS